MASNRGSFIPATEKLDQYIACFKLFFYEVVKRTRSSHTCHIEAALVHSRLKPFLLRRYGVIAHSGNRGFVSDYFNKL